jgi:UDP-GlcNAc:undecaprenyl-phosphate GlcNAc-1-phosphate transferase
MTTVALAAAAGSFVLSALLTLIVRAVARRRHWVDRPGGHKSHVAPIAMCGGVAIFWAIALPTLGGVLGVRGALAAHATDWLPTFLQPHLPGIGEQLPLLALLLGGAFVLHVVGLVDDFKPLGPGIKFAVQFAVAFALAVFGKIRAGEALGAAPAVLITALWFVVIINAFNFLDNMDGLSAGVGALVAAFLAIAAAGSGQIFVPALAWVVVGALLGFLVFNFSPATIFMGDAGSLVIGYFLALLTVLATYYDPDQQLEPMGVLVPPVVLAVPLYDVASVIRLRAGDSPFRGDRRHFSHRLVRSGMTPRAAVLTIYLATAATSVSAIFLPHLDWPHGLLMVGQCVCVVLIIAILESRVGTAHHAPRG